MSRVLLRQAVLLDMDGTLIDSTDSIETAWFSFADRHQLPRDAVAAALPGRTGVEIITGLLGNDCVDIDAELAAVRRIEADTSSTITALPGAARLLDMLPPTRWALVTAAPRDMMRRRMQAAGLCIPRIAICADDVTHGKPDPEGFLAAAELLGVRPERCAVFEDSIAGLHAAVRAGTTPIAVGATDTDPAALHVPDLTAIHITPTPGALRIHMP